MAKKRVLAIDDEDLVREVIEACLEDIGGWEVLLARSGSEGIAIAQSESIDAILLDVSMPGMDGIETFQKLQENSITQKIPVIFLTAKVQSTDKARFSQLGITGTIAKPFDPITLTEQIAALLHWEL